MKQLDIAFSPCPNDTIIFHAMLHGLVDTRGLKFIQYIYDVETLNEKAFAGKFRVTKMSFAAYLRLTDIYDILDSGAALGYGCGPLVVARNSGIDLHSATIAVPGQNTTANLLFRLRYPEVKNIEYTRFDNIMDGVRNGRYDAGVIIHEGRFIYSDYNLVKIIDLGEWWEQETGMPIPLGCIAIKKDEETILHKHDVESIIRESLSFGLSNRQASRKFIKSHAQEMDDTVIDSHINLYVNEFSLSLGEKGREAIRVLNEMVKKRQAI
ncbi:MAG: 1,4-dihydroxy-6-naphthoate synthase [Spirochaetota bacterium]